MSNYKIIGFLPGITKEDFVLPVFQKEGEKYLAFNENGFCKFMLFDLQRSKDNLLKLSIRKKYYNEHDVFSYYYCRNKSLTVINANNRQSAEKMVAKRKLDPLMKLAMVDAFKLSRVSELKLVRHACDELQKVFEQSDSNIHILGLLQDRKLAEHKSYFLKEGFPKETYIGSKTAKRADYFQPTDSRLIDSSISFINSDREEKKMKPVQQLDIIVWVEKNFLKKDVKLGRLKTVFAEIQSKSLLKKDILNKFFMIMIQSDILLNSIQSYKLYYDFLVYCRNNNISSDEIFLFYSKNVDINKIGYDVSFNFANIVNTLLAESGYNSKGILLNTFFKYGYTYDINLLGLAYKGLGNDEYLQIKDEVVEKSIELKNYDLLDYILAKL